jgi:hypothetical protein
MDMEPDQLRREYWTERNGLASVGDLARSVTTPRGRRTAARLTGPKLNRFDLICNVAAKRHIDLLAPIAEEGN